MLMPFNRKIFGTSRNVLIASQDKKEIIEITDSQEVSVSIADKNPEITEEANFTQEVTMLDLNDPNEGVNDTDDSNTGLKTAPKGRKMSLEQEIAHGQMMDTIDSQSISNVINDHNMESTQSKDMGEVDHMDNDVVDDEAKNEVADVLLHLHDTPVEYQPTAEEHRDDCNKPSTDKKKKLKF